MVRVDRNFWCKKRVFLTGHTGFKGSWLSLWLQSMGADVYGYALDVTTSPALFLEANVAVGMRGHTIGDIRNYAFLKRAIEESSPEIIFHMAAQPLVRYSYEEPIETYATNVMGTVHLFQAICELGGAKAIVNVTTDKCYENREWLWGYREDEPLGGFDPYSSSKACSELVTSAYRRSFFQNDKQGGAALASARAGNVIGGGDWALDRLIPDILRAFQCGGEVNIRNPSSVRPWQHVLEPLSGYLILAQRLYEHGQGFAESWNFGPSEEDARSVEWIVEKMTHLWGRGASWNVNQTHDQPHEATYLKLDISKAGGKLDWRPRWSLDKALERTIEWHRDFVDGGNVRAKCLQQILEYENFGSV